MLKPIIIASILLPFTADRAQAQPNDEQTVSKKVSYADLDLGNPAGQQTLDARIRKAAREICGPQGSNADLLHQADTRRCYREAVNSARSQRSVAIARAEQRKSQVLAAR